MSVHKTGFSRRLPFNYVMDWIENEHFAYQSVKTGAAEDDARTRNDPMAWENKIMNYFTRAMILGLDNPLGRQAVAKMAATAVGMAESVVRVHGELPAPGVPSGNNADNLWPAQ